MATINSVRVVKNKYGTYSLHFTNPDGRRRRLSVGKDSQHAQRFAVRFNDWLLEGKDPETEIDRVTKAEQVKRITFREFYSAFMEKHGILRSQKMQISYKNSFNNICRCSQLADSELKAVSKRIVLEYMHLRMKTDGVTAATVNKDAAFLKCMLSKAQEWDVLDSNPLKGFKLFKESGKRDVFLTPEQATALINELPDPIANIVEFAIYTGFRKENILSLRIKSLRFHDLTPTGEVELVVKGGKKELFPLGPTAIEVAKRAIDKRKEEYVFINPVTKTRYKSIHKTYDRAVRRLGLTIGDGSKLRFHDLRHVFATWLHKAGVSLDVLRSLLGHRDRATTDRYTTVERLEVGNVLSLIPSIRNNGQKKDFDYGQTEAL